MQSRRLFRVIAGLILLATGTSAAVAFGFWETVLSSMIIIGERGPYSRLILRIMTISLVAPGIILTLWEPFCSLLVRGQRQLDRLNNRSFLLITLITGGILRATAVVIMPLRLWADWTVYHELARIWAMTGEYTVGGHPTAFFPPGWPFFLSRLYLLFGANPYIGLIANIVLGTSIIYLGFRLVRNLWGNAPARWTAIILAIFPSQVLFTNLLCSEILFTVLFLAALNVGLKRVSSHSKGFLQWFICGLLLGLATLVRSLTLLLPLVMALYFFQQRTRPKVRAFLWLVLVAGLLTVTTPWIVRNYRQVGRATISTNGGIDFFIGNSWNLVAGHDNLNPARLQWDADPNEAYFDSLGYSLGWANIRQDPVAFLYRGILKSAYMIIPDHNGLTYELTDAVKGKKRSSSVWLAVTAQSFYFAFLLMAVVGLVSFLRVPALRNPGALMIILTLLYWLVVHFVFFGSGRFHFPIIPLLTGFASSAICEITRHRPR